VINVRIGSGWENLTGIFTECFKGFGMACVVPALVCTGTGKLREVPFGKGSGW